MVGDRDMVRVELRSGGEGESGAIRRDRFSLLVDPERMLVERVEGEEWLPGGLRQQTTLRIESMQLRDDRYVAEPLPESSPEAIEPPATVLPMRLGPAAVPFLEEDGRSVPPNRTPEEDQVEPSTPEQVPPSLPGVPQTTGLRG